MNVEPHSKVPGDELRALLQRYFGFAEFRPGQRQVIENILSGRHTLAVLPTGLGKSLCYQLASQVLDGWTLVISPLIALMQDQVEALIERGFANVTYLNSALSPAELGDRFAEMERGKYKLVYVAPERLDSLRFQQLVKNSKISLLVIDEAHCISQWGHDFRPHYLHLIERLPELKQATLLSVTATATPHTQRDIAAALQIPDIAMIIGDINRPNLIFECLKVNTREEKDSKLLQMLGEDEGAAIVYTSTRREAESVYQLLQSRGIRSSLYHAGLEAEHRSASQREFLQGRSRVIVATVAFGMGIDKPNIRRIIHYNLPASIENYYQEGGRAGRDGERAICTLLYWQQDVRTQRFFLEHRHAEPQIVFQLYELLFDAKPLPISANDLTTACGYKEIAVNAALQFLHEQGWIDQTPEGKYFLTKPETRRPQLNFRLVMDRKKFADERLKTMIEYATGYACRRAQILNYFGQKMNNSCDGCDVCLAPLRKVQVTSLRQKEQKAQTTSKSIDELYRQLRRWRRDKSASLNVWNFTLLSNEALNEICQKQPRNMQELATVKSITKDTVEKFGEEVISLIIQFRGDSGSAMSEMKDEVAIQASSESGTEILQRGEPEKETEKNEIYSSKVQAGSRTYFFDVKESQDGHTYLSIRETSEKEAHSQHRIMVFEENIHPFFDALVDAIEFLHLREANPVNTLTDDNSHKENKSYTVQQKRQKFINAYMKWTADEDNQLRELHAQGKTVRQLSEIFQRNSGAIQSRLRKLGLIK